MNLLAEIITIASDNDFSLARDLLALALADGKITEEENLALSNMCAKSNMYEEKSATLLDSPSNHDISMLSAPSIGLIQSTFSTWANERLPSIIKVLPPLILFL